MLCEGRVHTSLEPKQVKMLKRCSQQHTSVNKYTESALIEIHMQLHTAAIATAFVVSLETVLDDNASVPSLPIVTYIDNHK